MYYNYILNNYNSMSQTQIYTLMNDYKNLSDKLNEFNIKYATYVTSNCSTVPVPNNCVILESDLNIKGNAIIDFIDTVNYDINSIKNNKIDNVTLENEYNKIIADKNSINVTRKDLDSKIEELHNSIKANDIKTQYDSTLYTGIIFSVVATTILYYTFTKL